MSAERLIWYKYKLGQTLQPVGTVLGQVYIYPAFKSTMELKANKSSFSLNIKRATEDDGGMYFCGKSQGNIIEFSTGTFLAVTGNHHIFIIIC